MVVACFSDRDLKSYEDVEELIDTYRSLNRFSDPETLPF